MIPLRFGPSSVLIVACVAGCSLGAPRTPSIEAWDAVSCTAPRIEPDEQALWERAGKALETAREKKIVFTNESLETYLLGILARLTPVLPEDGPEFRIFVMEDVADNAYALPDGTILVSLPLLVTFDNEAQLAFVFSHEILHVTRRHSLLAARYRASSDSLVERMRFSRRREAEADRGAVALMEKAGYDVREAAPALKHVFREDHDKEDFNLDWSSHDDPASRLADLERLLRRTANPGGRIEREAFERGMDACRLRAAEIELEADRIAAAAALVDLHLERLPDSGRAYALRARITAEQDSGNRLSERVGEDLHRAAELGPNDPDALRALGLFLRDTGELDRSREMLRRYLDARPGAFDRRLIERYVGDEAD